MIRSINLTKGVNLDASKGYGREGTFARSEGIFTLMTGIDPGLRARIKAEWLKMRQLPIDKQSRVIFRSIVTRMVDKAVDRLLERLRSTSDAAIVWRGEC